jgi:hypothetical protein
MTAWPCSISRSNCSCCPSQRRYRTWCSAGQRGVGGVGGPWRVTAQPAAWPSAGRGQPPARTPTRWHQGSPGPSLPAPRHQPSPGRAARPPAAPAARRSQGARPHPPAPARCSRAAATPARPACAGPSTRGSWPRWRCRVRGGGGTPGRTRGASGPGQPCAAAGAAAGVELGARPGARAGAAGRRLVAGGEAAGGAREGAGGSPGRGRLAPVGQRGAGKAQLLLQVAPPQLLVRLHQLAQRGAGARQAAAAVRVQVPARRWRGRGSGSARRRRALAARRLRSGVMSGWAGWRWLVGE